MYNDIQRDKTMKFFCASEYGFPGDCIREVISSKVAAEDYVYSFHSSPNEIIRRCCSEFDIRCQFVNNSTEQGIDGIIKQFNICNKVILFYNNIEYGTGLDLLFKFCLKYKKPLILVNGKMKITNYKSKTITNEKVKIEDIHYTRGRYINDKYDEDTALFKLKTSYNNINEKKLKRRTILLKRKEDN